ncbi:MAG: type II secretion system GspH family protein [Fimbriimonadaceae bacterium]|nr:type II secretion system GspH family protein [Fimbriimonadaceae bacterium]
MARARRKGFTLIEIMIVVSIIGILLGIAMPAWIQARKQAWEKVRMQNCALIDRAKELWIQEKGKGPKEVAQVNDLVPEYIDPFPTDPAGSYQINAGNVPCSFTLN